MSWTWKASAAKHQGLWCLGEFTEGVNQNSGYEEASWLASDEKTQIHTHPDWGVQTHFSLSQEWIQESGESPWVCDQDHQYLLRAAREQKLYALNEQNVSIDRTSQLVSKSTYPVILRNKLHPFIVPHANTPRET